MRGLNGAQLEMLRRMSVDEYHQSTDEDFELYPEMEARELVIGTTGVTPDGRAFEGVTISPLGHLLLSALAENILAP